MSCLAKRLLPLCFLAFVGMAVSGPVGSAGAATPTYTTSTAGSTGSLPNSVAIGDLNGDGKPDLASANSVSNTVTVIMRNAAGTGWDAPTTAGTTGAGPAMVAIADLNGDGRLDLATANNSFRGGTSVTVITRNAAGTGWDAPVNAGTTGLTPFSLAIGDVNGDGRPDLVTANYNDDSVTVITRNANGTGWDTPITAGTTGSHPTSVAIGDLNGDGKPDLATADRSSTTVTVITRDATGTGWDASISAGTTGTSPTSVAIGDLNGDGKPDLATANGNNTVTVIARNAGGTGWETPVSAGSTGTNPQLVAIGDLNGDGKPDLATADNGSNRVTVITRNAAGSGWDAPVSAGSTGSNPASLAIGDLNGDGRPDLATADYFGDRVTVLMAATGNVPPATNFFTPSTAGTTGSQPLSVAIGDLNGDGKPDVAAANQSSNTVTVITRNAAGTGWDAPAPAGTTGSSPSSVAIGDVNGDGKPDLAAANFGGNTVTVITRNAAGTGWDAPVTAGTTGAFPSSVAIGDVNGDGRTDLVTANYFSSSVTVITRNAAGTGWDAPVSFGGVSGPTSVAIGDLNRDGKLDLATANNGSRTITVITRNAAGTGWDAPITAGTTGDEPRSVAIGDLNGDGKPDLAAVDNPSGDGGTATVITRNADGTGWDASVSAGSTGPGPYSVAIGDLNGDGKPDLATANYTSGTATVITRNASGTGWNSPVTAGTTGSGPISLAIGDVTGDGRPDLVTADLSGNDVTVLTAGYDGVSPVTTDDVPATYQTSSVTVTLTATDTGGSGVASVKYLVGASPADPSVPANNPQTYDPLSKPVLADGQKIRYFATDAAGNAETRKTSAAAKVDSIAPTSSDDVPATYRTAPVTVTLTGSDPGGSGLASIKYLKGASPADPSVPTNNPLTYDAGSKPVLADGEKIRYFATDNAGNAETPNASAAAKVDLAVPVTTDDVPTTYVNALATVTLTATDAGGSAGLVTSYRIVSAGGTPGSLQTYSSGTKPVLTDGERIRYSSTDGAGNAETAHDSSAAKVDQATPVTSDDVPTTHRNAPVTVTLTATDGGGSGDLVTTYRIVSAGGTPGTSQTYDASARPTLADGEKARYFTTDGAGNVEAAHDSIAAQVDGTVPVTQVTGRPAPVTSDPRPAITFTSQSATDTFQCAMDGAALAACTSPYRPGGPLSDGRHAFTVRAVSRADVPDPTPEQVVFVVDTSSPPQAAILSGPPARSDQTTQTFDFAGEPGSTFLCALDDAAPAPCTAPVSLTGLTVGNHRFHVVSVDAAGNRSPEQVTAFEITSTPVPPVDLQPTKARIFIVSTGQVTFLAGHTAIGCGVDRGVFATCTAKLLDRHGAVLASGRRSARQGGAASLSVRLARTHKGILASRMHPDGLRGTLIVTVTTTRGTQLSAQRKAVFIASDRVLIATTRSATLSSSVRRELAAIGTAFSAAPHVTCTAYTSRRGSAASARRLTHRQAKAACDLIGRYATSAVRVAVGVGHDRPRASNSTAAGRRLNQRVVVTFIPRYPARP